MKHQLAIYSNNHPDGINSCLCADTVAGAGEAARLQPVGGAAVIHSHGLGVERDAALPCSLRLLQQVGATPPALPPLLH